jgi:ABC-type multidrug transport system fused ATPase/permease subunit
MQGPPPTALGVVRKMFAAVGPEGRFLVTALCIVSFIAGLLETLLVYTVGRLALAVAAPSMDTAPIRIGPFSTEISIHTMTIVGVAVFVASIIVLIPTARIEAKLSETTLVRWRVRMLTAYMGASWTARSRHREGWLQELLGQYSSRVERLTSQSASLIVAGLSLAATLLGALLISPFITLGGMAMLGLISVGARPAAKRFKRRAGQYAKLQKEFIHEVAQTARVSQEITSFDVAGGVTKKLGRDIRKSARVLARFRLLGGLIADGYRFAALGVILAVLIILLAIKPGNVVSLAPLVLLMIRSTGYGRQVQNAVQSSRESVPYLDMVQTELTALRGEPIEPGSVDVERLGTVTFEDVSFAYVEGRNVLSGVSFSIEPGDALAVVGASGGGKSTMTQLLLRLRQPSAGKITVGGVDLAEVTPASWAHLVALVPQENKLVRASVADNIRFFRPEYDDEQVEAAARLAHIHDEIEALPAGYGTMVGPGERGLSGGQCQRLGIARALLGRPQLLVLDEPTSALDERSEELIRETLLELSGHTTLVVVAHRPATTEICNRRIRVERGHVEPVELRDHDGKTPLTA